MKTRLVLPFILVSVATAADLPVANTVKHSRELQDWTDKCVVELPAMCVAGIAGNVGLFFADVAECVNDFFEPGNAVFDVAECMWEEVFDGLSNQELETIENCILAAACFAMLPLELVKFLFDMADCIHDAIHSAFHARNSGKVFRNCLDDVYFKK